MLAEQMGIMVWVALVVMVKPLVFYLTTILFLFLGLYARRKVEKVTTFNDEMREGILYILPLIQIINTL
ncbi:hypothetical protein C0W93_02810 [Photobacterium leiognathi subsp. mandapamensis]|uniref:Uncharacterized protein n=1 Tax=Photobacterium leiognathi subsp. mandapamensis TaxID=48408 RepID=A0A2T3L0L0_PHOLD|nr:hypothetical protein C0W93_02810 [Photobacterium leiognathi subsp. mandapamensis]